MGSRQWCGSHARRFLIVLRHRRAHRRLRWGGSTVAALHQLLRRGNVDRRCGRAHPRDQRAWAAARPIQPGALGLIGRRARGLDRHGGTDVEDGRCGCGTPGQRGEQGLPAQLLGQGQGFGRRHWRWSRARLDRQPRGVGHGCGPAGRWRVAGGAGRRDRTPGEAVQRAIGPQRCVERPKAERRHSGADMGGPPRRAAAGADQGGARGYAAHDPTCQRPDCQRGGGAPRAEQPRTAPERRLRGYTSGCRKGRADWRVVWLHRSSPIAGFGMRLLPLNAPACWSTATSPVQSRDGPARASRSRPRWRRP